MAAKKNKTADGVKNDEVQKRPEENKTKTAESMAGETKSQTKPESEKMLGARKVKILKVVCRPEGTFLPNRIYEMDSKLAEKLIASGNAKEEQ